VLGWDSGAIYYSFTDFNGGLHRADNNIGNDGNPTTYAVDLNSDGTVATTNSPSFHMALDADGNRNNIDAVPSQPVEVTIDANTDPAQAASVMTQWVGPMNQNFTPTTGLAYTRALFHAPRRR
jgi:hypothetical protein